VTALAGTDATIAERARANEAFFAAEAERLARLCHRMAERFASGGRLLAFGATPAARSDARHVAVEFVHPVIMGKRALPALALEEDAFGEVEPGDIVMTFAADAGLHVALGADEWEFLPASDDPNVRQELVETLYHVLWELVHVFFDHRGLLEGRDARARHDAGASRFLYPFLAEEQVDLEAVVDDVRRSVLAKAAEIGALRTQTLEDNREPLRAAARDVRAALDAGGRLLALGNGGSATDAMDVVADFRADGRRALCLVDDPSILTAIANDVGVENLFARQVIAHGRTGDVLLAISTSGNSANVIAALAEARRRGLRKIALVGYDGGRVRAEGLADHVIVTRSEHIPRIQEAQAGAYHVLRELVEADHG
jgi:D-sedoheptulose 7-phosphate isomerase